jgi:hypothetical protein
MGGLKLMSGDRYVDPGFKGSQLVPSPNSPLVDSGRPAPMKKDLDGQRVGVDGNGDGKGGVDIGAYEAKPKHHRAGGRAHHGGKAHHGGRAHHGGKAHHGAKAHHGGKGKNHGGKGRHHHGHKHHHHGGRHHHNSRLT